MATGVNYWSSYEPSHKVSWSVWGGEQESSSEEGGGGVTWDTLAMEVKGQLISAPDPQICPDRKLNQRMAELQEKRRGLQALLSVRLAELRRICLQEAELTGLVPSDFPLEEGEKPPCVRRRWGLSRQGNRKCRAEEEDSQRSKPKKTLFSGALRKHSDSEHNTHIQTQTHHGKRTVHRGCHTDDSVRSESSSTSDSTGHDNDEGASQCRPPLVSAGSPVEVFYQNKTTRNRSDYPETHQIHRPLPPPPSHPPPRSQDSSSSGPSEPGAAGEGLVRVNTARRSNGSDGFPDRITPPEEGGLQQGGMWVNGVPGSRGTNATGVFRSSNALLDGRTRINNGPTEVGMREGGAGRGRGRGGRGGGYSEVLLDYVWGKQQQLQRQQSQPNSRQPITSQHQPLYNGHSSQQLPGALPTYHGPHGDQQRVKVTRTKSCGPFLPMQQSQSNTHNPPASTIQPDPHPHLLPPRPPQLPPNQDSQLEEATRSLHKALALEGLRDWYLRNTVGSTHQNQTGAKVNSGVGTNVNGGLKGLAGGGGALQRRRTTHGIIHQSTYQAETSHRHATSRHKQTLPHSATFHGHPLHGRSVDSSLYHDSFPPQKQEVPLRDSTVDQPSPGTLV
ncbi:coiled-coil domain-containing protein 120 [Anabas testudineus]|uniref:coiled-coil domain-containing protein 120 n=1 Tax=Anabas testudineus TaxID=64144 RepID=UPI000E458A61|nr:coiled-coil domain-containing protein 120 [Anabas testudineus]XP_026223470.1 coiled-coil domain-containing protein 120 [Anabas testudineus]XP_026223471.1 coiled-coil domain-containing protein 120 [Anabas testudineus]